MLSFNTTNDPFNVETNTLILSMWQEAFGDQHRRHDHPDRAGPVHRPRPQRDLRDPRLATATAARTPTSSAAGGTRRRPSRSATVGTNFGRFVDPVIDENLDIIRTNGDPDARREATEAINRQFGEQVYNLWLNWALWGVITQPQVNGVEVNVLPGGGNGPGGLLRWPPPDRPALVRRGRLRLNPTERSASVPARPLCGGRAGARCTVARATTLRRCINVSPGTGRRADRRGPTRSSDLASTSSATFTRQLRDRQLRPACEQCRAAKRRAVTIIDHPPREELLCGTGSICRTRRRRGGGLECVVVRRCARPLRPVARVLSEPKDQPDALDQISRALGG